MTLLGLPLYVYGSVAALAAALPLLWWSVASADPLSKLVRANLPQPAPGRTDVREVQLSRSARERLLDPVVGALGRLGHRVVPSGIVEALEHRLALAGQVNRWPVERVLALKLVLATFGFALGLLFFAANPTVGGAVVGLALPTGAYHVPEVALAQTAKQRQHAIARKLPDTLDEITISVEAGLGFEAAMAEAGRSGTGPVAEELVRTLQEIQIGVPRATALSNLVWRTDVPDLRHFVIAVRQAERYGVPIAQVLRVQSKEMRERRRQRAEERAMKMPVKILVPTVFFILPALFIVILGPAVLRLADSLGG